MLPILRIFGFSLQTPLLVLMISYVLAIWMTSRMATLAGMNGSVISDAGFYGVIIGVIGARLGYVLLNLEPYLREPLSAFMPSTTALHPLIGISAGTLFILYYLKRHHALKAALLDAFAYGIPFLLVGLALASFFSGDSYGTSTQLPWSVYIWGASRHPIQLYECAILVLAVVSMYATRQTSLMVGMRLLLLVAFYGLARIFIDGFRADAITIAGLRVTQLAGVVISTTAILLLGELLSSRQLAIVGDTVVSDEPAGESGNPIT